MCLDEVWRRRVQGDLDSAEHWPRPSACLVQRLEGSGLARTPKSDFALFRQT